MIDLPLLVERMTAGAAPYELPVPSLATGSPANLCMADLDADWTVGEAGYESRSGNSCFAGRELRGRVLMTVAAGSVAWRERGFSIRLADGRRRARASRCAPGGDVKLDRSRAALAVIDVQEAFRPAVLDFDQVARNTAVLVQGARILGVPVLVTEQYPKGLGQHRARGRRAPEGIEPLEKVCFSAVEAERLSSALAEHERDQVLLCGIETHVCVNQTAEDLLGDGFEVHIAADAVTSRTAQNRELGLHKMEHAGATLTSVETALFELLRQAGTPEFKEMQKLVDEVDRHAYVLLEDGTRLDGEAAGAPVPAVGRGRLQHRDDRLPGGGHRPLLQRPGDHVHLSADRQLRRLGRQHGVRPRARARGDHARAGEPAPGGRRGRLARLAEREGDPGDRRHRHPRAGAPHPRPRRDARRRVPGEVTERQARELIAAEPSMSGRDLAAV